MPIKYNWLGCFYLACQWPSTNSSLRKRYNYCIWRRTRDENFFVNESFQPRFLAENAALPAAASHVAPVADRRPCCTCIDISWPPGPQQQTRISGGRHPPVCLSVPWRSCLGYSHRRPTVVHGSILCEPIQPNPSADPTQPNPTHYKWKNLDPTQYNRCPLIY